MYVTSMAQTNVSKATVPDRRIQLPTPAYVIVAVRLSKALNTLRAGLRYIRTWILA